MQSLKANKSYSTIRACVKTIYEKEGIKGFFTGSYSNILRGIGSSLCLLLYDEIKDVQHKYINKKHWKISILWEHSQFFVKFIYLQIF